MRAHSPISIAAFAVGFALVGPAHRLPAQETKAGHAHVARAVSGATTDNAVGLLDAARQATKIYTERSVAIAAGYRRIGRDFPSMGEHWLSPRLIVEGAFDVSRPSVLTYVMIDRRPVLTGVVYAIPLAPGEVPPDAFGPTALWHEHNGTIDEEGLLAQHHTTPQAATGTRVAVLHAWTRLANPDGMFSAENWAIPFVRLHLAVPEKFPESAARALSLLGGGKTFFMDLAGSGADTTVSMALDECETAANEIVSRTRAGDHVLTEQEVVRLQSAWERVVARVAERNPELAQRLNGQ